MNGAEGSAPHNRGGQEQRLWVTTLTGCDLDRCTQILDECGFLPTGRFGVLNFCGIPDGLSAEELAEGYVLTCQAVPTSDTVAVNYDA